MALTQFPSGYTGMGNDPGNLIDPDGCQVSMGGGTGTSTTAGVSGMSLNDFGEHWANVTILGDTRFDHPVNSFAWGLGSIGGGGQGAGALVVYSPDPMSTGYGYYNWGSMEIPGSISPTNKISVSLDQFESMVRAPAFYAESALQSKLNSNERSGYEKANLMVGGVGVVPATIEMGTILIKNSANYTDDIARIARVTSRAGKLLGVASMTLTVVDGLTSKEGWKKHNTADLLIGGAQTFLLGTGPVGWGINIIWISADLITTGIPSSSTKCNTRHPKCGGAPPHLG